MVLEKYDISYTDGADKVNINFYKDNVLKYYKNSFKHILNLINCNKILIREIL